ncbi:type I-C CRISPR-associated protein Cas8c/Csd1 [Robertmurraya massiliosenegalensis]|uniref:type I-C CRISPR-associated protein Cas8c/Csd1 n=1 Tax=Robertmurraya massiliosenegalensis TaxID=1287657 RepID=UPI0002EF99AC|nr:type I-C CRISPR-associated protein Cas8c/Csd1 [Robertmurraya massiliosenegalensis]
MTWLRNLYETYNSNNKFIGEFEKNKFDQEYALIPVAHTTQSAQIEVVLDINGNFISAKVVEKSDASTIVPCTDASANRTSAPAPHPLFDKLVYVAGDYLKYGGVAKKGNPHSDYMTQLKSWCDSKYGHPKVKSVYTYVKKSRLIEDLVNEGIIYVDENNRFIEKWSNSIKEKYGEKPALFKVLNSDQSEAFVRFSVITVGEPELRLWRDSSIHKSFTSFYEDSLEDMDLCYVTGKILPSTEKHASGIRRPGDMAKLICKNNSKLTYFGRFKTTREAVSISNEVSQKAHNALKWLIAKQGYTIDGKVFLVWGKDNVEIPSPYEDSETLGLYDDFESELLGDVTHKEFASQVQLAISGYRNSLEYKSSVIIMIIDAATPGRMSVVYYRDMDKDLFLNRIENWHKTCYWLHQYKKGIKFHGAPATKDIAFAAYGLKVNEKVIKGLVERMLPSIIDGRAIPLDIVKSVFNRASNPVSMDKWEWEKTLSIACALIRKTYEKEEIDVALDKNNDNRDYLFGRMLAIADVLERTALDNDEKRSTNAIRYMNAFSRHPFRTWNVIQASIQPYQAKLGTRLNYLSSLLDEVGSKMKPNEFTDEPLSGMYLLGFYSQRHALYKGKKKDEEKGEM